MPEKPRTLAAFTRARSFVETEQNFARLRDFLDEPIAGVRITFSGISSVAGQVIDRTNNPWKRQSGPWLVRLWVATASGGAAGGSQTVTFTSGTPRTITANQEYEVLTEADGSFGFTMSGSGERWIAATVLGAPAWTRRA